MAHDQVVPTHPAGLKRRLDLDRHHSLQRRKEQKLIHGLCSFKIFEIRIDPTCIGLIVLFGTPVLARILRDLITFDIFLMDRRTFGTPTQI
jgi:hypothetical protein